MREKVLIAKKGTLNPFWRKIAEAVVEVKRQTETFLSEITACSESKLFS